MSRRPRKQRATSSQKLCREDDEWSGIVEIEDIEWSRMAEIENDEQSEIAEMGDDGRSGIAETGWRVSGNIKIAGTEQRRVAAAITRAETSESEGMKAQESGPETFHGRSIE